MPTAADFVLALRQTGLLPPEQLDELTHDLAARFPEPRAVAAELVKRGWLTAYQANLLLQGKGDRLVLGSYQLLDRLGEGGMGEVFKARHRKLGRVVALKLIRKERIDNPDTVRRFRREIEAAATLSHPNVVLALDADQAGDTHFFAMEYVEGTDLSKHVKQQGPLPVCEACEYIRQAALGLQHAHERGLVHRDIKPSNLLLSWVTCHSSGARTSEATAKGPMTHDKGQIKILDMGLARFSREGETSESFSTLTQEGSVMGTLDYISPEQARDSHTVDIRADLYSLGCTFYFLLSGRAPFPGGTAMKKLMRHQTEEPTPIEQLCPDTQGAVGEVVRTLMAKKPEDRFQTPAELALVLAAILDEAGRGPAVGRGSPDPAPAHSASNDGTEVEQSSVISEFVGLADRSGATTLPPDGKQRAGQRRRTLWMYGIGAGISLAFAALATVVIINAFGGARPTESSRTAQTTEKQSPPQDPRKAEEEAERKRSQEADAALKPIGERVAVLDTGPSEEGDKLRKDLREFLMQHSATPAATKACDLLGQVLAKLPSPLDQLDPAKIPEDAKEIWKAMDWRQPVELVGVLGEHRQRQWGQAQAVVWNRQRNVIASAGQDGLIWLWDPDTLKLRQTLKGHTLGVFSLAISADGRWLASAHGDVIVWDLDANKEARRYPMTQEAQTVAISNDGSLVAAGGRENVTVWKRDSGKEVCRCVLGGTVDNYPFSLKFTPNNRQLISGGVDDTIRVWDVETGKELGRFECEPPKDGPHHIYGLALSADGRHLLTGNWDGSIRWWEVETRKQIRAFEPLFRGTGCVALSPDGSQALSADALALRLWDMGTGKLIRAIDRPWTYHHSVAFSPDGKRAVAVSDDGTVRLWDVDTGKEVQPLKGHFGVVACIGFSPDDRYLLSGGGQMMRLWDTGTGQELRHFLLPQFNSYDNAFLPDGRRALVSSASGYWGTHLWDLETDKDLGHFGPYLGRSFLSSDGRRVLLGGLDGTLQLWDVENAKEMRRFTGHTGHCGSVALSPDGRYALSGNGDGTMRLWDVETGKELRRFVGHTTWANVSFSPDGRFALDAGGESVRLWDLRAGASKGPTIFRGHSLSVAGLAFSPNGKTLASAGHDGRLILWDPATGTKLREWQLPGPVYRLAFAHDGRHLATANGNGTVYILRIADGPPRALSPDEAKKQ